MELKEAALSDTSSLTIGVLKLGWDELTAVQMALMRGDSKVRFEGFLPGDCLLVDMVMEGEEIDIFFFFEMDSNLDWSLVDNLDWLSGVMIWKGHQMEMKMELNCLIRNWDKKELSVLFLE